MDVVTLSRIQFGVTTAFHFLFVPLTLGLVWFVAIFQTQYYRTGEERFRRMAKFWGKLFLVNFGMGIVTGLVQEFQFGMNWSEYSRFVGDIFGALLAIETMVAFFLESVFIGIWIFGEGHVSKRVHLFSIWMAAIGSLLSSIWILLASGWMHHPVGYIINPVTGNAQLVDIVALLTNPKGWLLFRHAFSAGLATAAFFLLGVSSWYIMRKKELDVFKPSFATGAVVGLIASFLLLMTGHEQGQEMRLYQPMKLAAIEAIWETEQPASFSFLTIGDLTGKQEIWSIRIPYLMSFLACNNFDCKIQGVNELQAEYEALYGPNDYIPLMVATYWSFRTMFAMGFVMLFTSAFAVLVVARNWSPKLVKWLKWMPYTIPLPFIAGVAGWVTTEMGRQPWIVQGLLTTAQAISPNLTVTNVTISLVGFTLLYGALAVVMVQLIYKFARQGTEAALTKSVDVEEPVSTDAIIFVGAQD
ncbi:MAG: cytochrome ubiquinol oxidase subunit I [Anaerolineales bacterium]|nr:cytochrome ubiquinol oxidase subunit I [Anaerolineales bacterium]